MSPVVTTERVSPRVLAAVRRQVAVGEARAAWKPALDLVWAFLRTKPGLRTDGHNIFLYHHPTAPGAPMTADFGVEVTRRFEPEGEVFATETPAGEVAKAVHVGGYDGLWMAHDAIQAWAHESGRTFAGTSWEIYGDWSDDPTKIETTVVYLLR